MLYLILFCFPGLLAALLADRISGNRLSSRGLILLAMADIFFIDLAIMLFRSCSGALESVIYFRDGFRVSTALLLMMTALAMAVPVTALQGWILRRHNRNTDGDAENV